MTNAALTNAATTNGTTTNGTTTSAARPSAALTELSRQPARPPAEVLGWSLRLVGPALRAAVDTLPPSMHRMAGYHFGWWEADGNPNGGVPGTGGKALRPALALLAAEVVGGEPEPALPAAVAVELVHNFSLIQDDMIDGDRTRRHRPTVWSVFGTGQAIVAGDALLALAYELLVAAGPGRDGGVPPGRRSGQGTTQLLHAAVLDLLEGQHADLAFEQRTDVELTECLAMAEGKSGALLSCACGLGALLGGGTPAQVSRLRRFGSQVGLAFQLADDLLGIWGDPAVTGKPVYSDLRRRKKTLPVVAALTAGSTDAAALAELYHRDQPLSDAEVARAAELIERAGGREWCRRHADSLLADALQQLSAAADGPAEAAPAALEPAHAAPAATARATAELAGLARLAARRNR